MSDIIELRNEIERAAERLGASRAAIFKWRQRGVPKEWRIRLFEDAQTAFAFGDFDCFEKIRDAAHAASSSPRVPSP